MTEFCLICLKSVDYLIRVTGNDPGGDEIIQKLKNCVPEVDWNICFKICNCCRDELNKIYNFRKLCISSYTTWQRSTIYGSIKLEGDVKVNELSFEGDTVIENDEQISDEEEKLTNNICFQCFECSSVFETKLVLKNHIKQAHTSKKKTLGKKDIPCSYCGKLYTTHNSMRKHLNICRKKNEGLKRNTEPKNSSKHLNSYQGKSANGNSLELSSDIKVKDTDIKIAPTCSLCGTTFCNKYLLKRHLQNVHATEKKFKCDTCGRTFASAVYLNAHKRYHMGDRSHICPFCGKGFITASDLYHHEKIHANKRAYRCEICPKAFNTSSDLHKHKICVHLNRLEWKYVCKYCERRFPLKTNLDTHIKTHTGEKNYACHLCDRKCINKSVLMRHIETHSNIIAFKCNICMQGYKYRKSLDIHMSKVHGIGNVKVPERIKKFFCHLCTKSYFAKSALQKHIRTHSGEKPFRCSSCEKSFIDKTYLKKHLKIAHDIVDVTKVEF